MLENRPGPRAHLPARPSTKSLNTWHFPAKRYEVELQVRIAKCRSGFLRVSRQLSERAYEARNGKPLELAVCVGLFAVF